MHLCGSLCARGILEPNRTVVFDCQIHIFSIGCRARSYNQKVWKKRKGDPTLPVR